MAFTENDEYKIKSIYGHENIGKWINPSNNWRKTYIALDRLNASVGKDKSSRFRWDFANNKNYADGSVMVSLPISNIINIKIMDFAMPINDYSQDITPYRDYGKYFTFLIEEFSSESFGNGIDSFHFLGKLGGALSSSSANLAQLEGGAVMSFNGKYISSGRFTGTNDERRGDMNSGNYRFNEPIKYIDQITLQIKQLHDKYELNGMMFDGAFDISGIGFINNINITLPTGNTIPSNGTNPVVYITGFTTSNPTADDQYIKLINRKEGFNYTISTSTTITLVYFTKEQQASATLIFPSVGDFTGVVNPNITATFELPNFIIPLEITYIAND